MSDAKALLSEIEAGLEGVTPGPWSVGDRFITAQDGPISDLDYWYVGHRVDDDPANLDLSVINRNAAHVARCDPDTMRAIIAYVRELEAENTQFREALCLCVLYERFTETGTGKAIIAKARAALEPSHDNG